MKSCKLRIQAVLYENDENALARSIESIEAASRYAQTVFSGLEEVDLVYGDAGPKQMGEELIIRLKSLCGDDVSLRYVYFDENTGYGRGHNMLAAEAGYDYVLLINPDIVFEPRCIARMLEEPLNDSSIGLVEARQAPLEIPKYYDRRTGDTSWGTGACMLVSAEAYRAVEGFDAGSFFMYCEDVDISWRVRMLGKRVIYRPDAIAYHPKEISVQGCNVHTDFTRYYGALTDMVMAHKWGNEELLQRHIAYFENEGDSIGKKALADYRELEASGKLIPQDDARTRFCKEFGDYPRYRFTL